MQEILTILKIFPEKSRYHFVKGDIRDRKLLNELFQRFDIQVVINFAAESHVDRSIEDPAIFLNTNVLGTQTLLETAKNHWKVNPSDENCRKFKDNVKYIQISTDEVYGTLGKMDILRKRQIYLQTVHIRPPKHPRI